MSWIRTVTLSSSSAEDVPIASRLSITKDGFCLLYKRLEKGANYHFRFQWPRHASEVRNLTKREFRWLLEGLSIDQPNAIQQSRGKYDF